jgi:hypothetical protein
VQRKGVIARLLKSRAKPPLIVNLRGIPSSVCLNCGHLVFQVGCMFEDNEISLWFTDAKCADCGALVTVPTPVDDNENTFNTDFCD